MITFVCCLLEPAHPEVNYGKHLVEANEKALASSEYTDCANMRRTIWSKTWLNHHSRKFSWQQKTKIEHIGTPT